MPVSDILKTYIHQYEPFTTTYSVNSYEEEIQIMSSSRNNIYSVSIGVTFPCQSRQKKDCKKIYFFLPARVAEMEMLCKWNASFSLNGLERRN